MTVYLFNPNLAIIALFSPGGWAPNKEGKLNWQNIKKIVSEYDQEIPQSQTADNPVAPRGRAAQPSQDTSSLFPIKMIAILEWT